jgi:ABC-type antimicrobial peptide transport system permease subunit
VDARARYRLSSLDDEYAKRHAETRLATSVVSAFAGIAFLIAIAGVFGVMTFLVLSRKREIAIRLALGAGRRDVRRIVFNSSLRLAVGGVAIGATGAILAGRFIESQLFGVTPTDPSTYAIVCAAVLLSSWLGAWLPAWRAGRTDPTATLRTE